MPIVPAGSLDGKNVDELYQCRIWVGRQPKLDEAIGAELDKLDADGFIVRRVGGDVYVSGRYWWGTNWAAHDLLERFAGCRWYGPEPTWWEPKEPKVGLWDIVPHLSAVMCEVCMIALQSRNGKSASEVGSWIRAYSCHP